jgi:hypothetical protein
VKFIGQGFGAFEFVAIDSHGFVFSGGGGEGVGIGRQLLGRPTTRLLKRRKFIRDIEIHSGSPWD